MRVPVPNDRSLWITGGIKSDSFPGVSNYKNQVYVRAEVHIQHLRTSICYVCKRKAVKLAVGLDWAFI